MWVLNLKKDLKEVIWAPASRNLSRPAHTRPTVRQPSCPQLVHQLEEVKRSENFPAYALAYLCSGLFPVAFGPLCSNCIPLFFSVVLSCKSIEIPKPQLQTQLTSY